MPTCTGILMVHRDYPLRKETQGKNPVLGDDHMFGLDMSKLRYLLEILVRNTRRIWGSKQTRGSSLKICGFLKNLHTQ